MVNLSSCCLKKKFPSLIQKLITLKLFLEKNKIPDVYQHNHQNLHLYNQSLDFHADNCNLDIEKHLRIVVDTSFAVHAIADLSIENVDNARQMMIDVVVDN